MQVYYSVDHVHVVLCRHLGYNLRISILVCFDIVVVLKVLLQLWVILIFQYFVHVQMSLVEGVEATKVHPAAISLFPMSISAFVIVCP